MPGDHWPMRNIAEQGDMTDQAWTPPADAQMSVPVTDGADVQMKEDDNVEK